MQNWKKVLIWVIVAMTCGYFAFLTNYLGYYGLPGYTTEEFFHSCKYCSTPCISGTIELQPGQTLEQQFTAMGNIVGYCEELYLEGKPSVENSFSVLTAELYSWDRGECLTTAEQTPAEAEEDGRITFAFPDAIIIKSGEDYALKVTNNSDEPVVLRVNHSVQSGKLYFNGAEMDSFLNFGFLRTSMYSPSALLKCMLLMTSLTVLIGLALVLFGNVKEHVLYLVLAVGFGIVTLFDLTPLYGFDMKFQFDSTYVVSNELLGMEGVVYAPSEKNPDINVAYYYRRTCDDYSLYQFLSLDSVSDNYTDVVAGLKNLRADEGEQELILVESAQGFVGEQLYLYLPQAIGFAIARLLGLGYIPMLELGRAATYAVFVLMTFFAIRSIPFGKRLMMIFALAPTVMTQTVAITRDAPIIGMSFFIIAKVLQIAYADRRPTAWDWGTVLAVSALLAPCKMVYLPVSFFWLLIIYRQYIYNQEINKSGILMRVGCYAMIVLGAFVLLNLPSITGSSELGTAQNGAPEEAYSVLYVLTHIPQALMVVMNSIRSSFGSYLVNAFQLFAIDLGSNDMITIFILFLLFVESFCENDNAKMLLGERWFGGLVVIGVFCLILLASLQWTPQGSYIIIGFQGRYMTPVLPLACLVCMNNRALRIKGNTEVFVKASCCIFPAIYLMNMYLWTISK